MSAGRVLRKDELEARLHEENKEISEGRLKDDNPLDLSENFRKLCEACRRGDLKVCQEMITEGTNINARDQFDYTPLILVSSLWEAKPDKSRRARSLTLVTLRLVFVGTTKLCSCCLNPGHSVNEIHSKE